MNNKCQVCGEPCTLHRCKSCYYKDRRNSPTRYLRNRGKDITHLGIRINFCCSECGKWTTKYKDDERKICFKCKLKHSNNKNKGVCGDGSRHNPYYA